MIHAPFLYVVVTTLRASSMTNKKLIINDILENSKISEEHLASYSYYEKENNIWFYQPYIVRYENEGFVQSWHYFVNNVGRVLSSQVNYWGEDHLKVDEESVYICDEIKFDLNKVTEIFHKQINFFADKIFLKNFTEINTKYSLEIILQKNNDLRIRVRPLLGLKISYDFYYNSRSEKLIMNTFDP